MAKSTKSNTAIVTVSNYKNTPVVNIPLGDDSVLMVGPAKAKAILSNMADLITFIQPKPTSAKAQITKFKGSPILKLVKTGKPFSLGVKKAQAVVQHAGAIAQFVVSNS